METGTWQGRGWIALAALCLLSLGLLAMTRFIAGWDPIQFALGIDHFDLAMHQPHPPGYLGHLVLAWLLAQVGLTPDRAVLWASLLEAVLAIPILADLGRRLGDRRVGLVAAWLLATHPLMVQQAVSGEVYPAEALLAVCLVRAGLSLGPTSSPFAIARFFLFLGLSGGVRQSLPLFLAPFALWRWGIARGRGPIEVAGRLGIAAGAGLLGVLFWLVPLALLAGGLDNLSQAFGRQFFQVFGRAYSPLLGAPSAAIWTNLEGLWRFLIQVVSVSGVLALGLELPARLRRGLRDPIAERCKTALLWALPPLAWFFLLFIYKAGHALSLVPLVCLLAAWNIVASAPGGPELRRVWIAGWTALGVAIQVWGFLAPPAGWTRLTGDAGLPGFWYLDRETEAFTGLVRDLSAGDPGRVLVVTRDGRFSFRRAMWHLPEVPVQWWMDRDSTGVPMPGVQVCQALGRRVSCRPGPGFWETGPLPSRMDIPIPEHLRFIVWFADPSGPVARLLPDLPGTALHRVPGTPFETWVTRVPEGPLVLEIGPYRLMRPFPQPEVQPDPQGGGPGVEAGPSPGHPAPW